ncbi:MAG TPA: GntR family transcriptional regulator [Phycisphaerae bacterium]|nr:GntR family transcriptional regulator [Phycisphaerae bacterium]HRY66607.1 GntR family transcriptional regulator [Phycisphaerae bacterium]HSA27027.1 GntR family transcriptional regulator [Phycisphaerae bacterium]
MVTRPIRRVNFVDEAYAAIRRLIVSGEFPPGAQLKIDALARILGVSNSPIREALRRLENERWVQTIPYRGAFVRALDEVELVELYELREFIETSALRKAMPRPAGAHLKALGEAQRRIRAALRGKDLAAYLAADTRFHRIIVEMAGNRRLSELFATLIEQGKCFMLGRTQRAIARYRDGRDQHAEMVEAIAGGDTAKALGLLQRHLRITLEQVRRLASRE